MTSTGHCHPKVVKAIRDQAASLIFGQQNVFLGSKPLVRQATSRTYSACLYTARARLHSLTNGRSTNFALCCWAQASSCRGAVPAAEGPNLLSWHCVLPQAGVLDRLLSIVPSELSRFTFGNSGSEAVENAVKIARAHTKRRAVIAVEVPLAQQPPSKPGHPRLLPAL